MGKNVMDSKLLLYCVFGCVLTIYCFFYKYPSNYNFLKQPKVKGEISKFKNHPISNSNQKKTSKELKNMDERKGKEI